MLQLTQNCSDGAPEILCHSKMGGSIPARVGVLLRALWSAHVWAGESVISLTPGTCPLPLGYLIMSVATTGSNVTPLPIWCTGQLHVASNKMYFLTISHKAIETTERLREQQSPLESTKGDTSGCRLIRSHAEPCAADISFPQMSVPCWIMLSRNFIYLYFRALEAFDLLNCKCNFSTAVLNTTLHSAWWCFIKSQWITQIYD